MFIKSPRRLLTAGLIVPFVTFAQEVPSGSASSLEEVFVTATKQVEAVAVQDVAAAVTAYSSEDLQKGFNSSLQSLTVKMPNVQLDGIGSQKATANFTIRGLGLNSSIPSIEPTVGTFYDGVYLGINGGVMYDFFDVASVEVLRGPQGLLFGRNTTGGAIVINTRKPSDVFEATMKMSTTHKLDSVVAASVSGPLIDDTLKVRLTGYFNDDQGWFENERDGDDFGKSELWFVRPALTWTPTDDVELTLRYEQGKYDGQGSASQNPSPGLAGHEGRHRRDSFSFNIDEEGFSVGEWRMAIAELNYRLGPGTLTNILGWRTYDEDALADLDGRPLAILHWLFMTDQEQLSDELRYAVNFDRVKLTTGLFWFTQDIDYLEARLVPTSTANPLGVPTTIGHLGGVQDSETLAAFASADINLTDRLILNLGARYSHEEKEAQVADFGTAANGRDPCPGIGFQRGLRPSDVCRFSFPAAGDRGSSQWSDLTPRIGLQYFFSDDAQIYAFATEGFRSGGYNMRNATAGVKAGPFDPEELRSYELGGKVDWLDGRLRTNVALFYNEMTKMQREIIVTTGAGGGGIGQSIRNTADALIKGAELEVAASLTPLVTLIGNVGYVDGAYVPGSLRFDLSGDSVINRVDENLRIPRLVKLTWGVGANCDLPLGLGRSLNARVNFNHRDRSPFSENNRGMLNSVNILDAAATLSLLDERLSVGVFGKNLTNEVIEGNVAPLAGDVYSGVVGNTDSRVFGAYRPLMKGRVYGLEVHYRL
jgi:iron complex outermembrane recepter protein